MAIRTMGACLAIAFGVTGLFGCDDETPATPAATEQQAAEPTAPALQHDRGVDLEGKVIRIGMLNDESGPAAAIGRPYANGKRLLAALVNAGGSGLLPEGWTVELIEKDHGYNPQRSVQSYNEIKDQVLFIGTSFGTPNTLPLRPMLERDTMVAFGASLSSQMAEHRHTPPIGPSYRIEAMRAMDWVVESTEDASTIKAGIVYQQDDYGQDGLEGWRQAARHHNVQIVSEQATAPGQQDFTAAVTALKEAGATHVLLTTLPSATGPILGKAAQLQFGPVWVGNTPSWIDGFFNPEVIPAAVFGRFHWVTGLPYWGEDVPGMDRFTSAFERFGGEMGGQDFYILVSFIQGMAELEGVKRAIERGNVTRAGYLEALQTIDNWNAGGMIRPLNLTRFPYVTGTRTRILRPQMGERTWEQVADYRDPASLNAGAPQNPGETG
jgi:ABC-type branched-subunit amino acid transport system substrate-binding protein